MPKPSVLARIREFPRLILEAAPSAAIFRIGVLPDRDGAVLLGELRELAAQSDLDFASLARASGILYAAFLPKEGEHGTRWRSLAKAVAGSVSRLRQAGNQRFGDAGVVPDGSENARGRRVGPAAAGFCVDAAREKCLSIRKMS